MRNRVSMVRGRPLVLGMLSSLLVLAVAATPASAVTLISESGQHGNYGWIPPDNADSPAGRCGYSAENNMGEAFLRWIKMRAPVIFARDTTAGQDSQKASWQVVVQRRIGTGPWRKVASSGQQTRTTWDDHSADFDPIKVYVNGQAGQQFRAVVNLRWMRSGSVEGLVKLATDFYGVKWTVGTPDYVYEDACDGAAD